MEPRDGDGVPARRNPQGPGLRRLSHRPALRPAADRLLFVPPGKLQADERPRPRLRGFFNGLSNLPFNAGLERRLVRPFLIPPGRKAPDAGLFRLPRERSLPGDADRLRRLPSRRLQQRLGAQSRRCRFPDGLRLLPFGLARFLGPGRLQSHLPDHEREAFGIRLHGMPHDQQLPAVQLPQLPRKVEHGFSSRRCHGLHLQLPGVFRLSSGRER